MSRAFKDLGRPAGGALGRRAAPLRRCEIHALWLSAVGVLWTWPALVPASESLPQRPNVLLLVSDDQRPDSLAVYGNTMIATPNLDRLAEQGVRFTRAVAPHPLCVPSRAEILTGYSSLRPGVMKLSDSRGRPLRTWAETMRQAGYHTWYVGKWHSAGRPRTRGYEESRALFAGGGKQPDGAVDHKGRPVTGYRGWVLQTDSGQKYPEKGIGLTPNISATFADAAVALLESRPDRPFFLHVNFTAPHDPLLWPTGYEKRYSGARIALPANYLPVHPFDHGNLTGRDELLWPTPRSPQDVRDELAVYYAVIEYLDAQIGRILAALERTGQADRTLVIFTSDHGLAIGSHGLRGKQNMYEHTIGVPLLVRGPGLLQKARSDAQVYLRDLYPTVAELCGLPAPPGIDGVSFAPVLRGTRTVCHDAITGYFLDAQRMIRTDEFKLVWYPKQDRYQLFDIRQDPDELRDLAAAVSHASLRDRLRRRLDVELARFAAAPNSRPAE